MKISTLAFSAIALVMLVASASAQKIASESQSQKASVQTELSFRASNARATLSVQSIDEIARHASSVDVAHLSTMIPQAANSLSGEIATQISLIASGVARSFTTGVIKAGDVMDQRSITMKVSFEPRPIGGILSVRVDLVPVFAGIGGASRPAASRSEAQAIERVDEATVQQMVSRLSDQLAAQYEASK